MAFFPLFVDLKGKICIVVGGGRIALQKVESLLPFEPEIWIVSPKISESLKLLFEKKLLNIITECYDIEHTKNAYLIIAATDDPEVNRLVYEHAISRNIFVNVVDCPEKCTIFFPAIVKRNDLVVGISSSGAYPSLARELKKKIEQDLPEYYADLVVLLRAARKKVKNEIADQEQRKLVLDKILEYFMKELERGNICVLAENHDTIIEKIIISSGFTHNTASQG